MQHFHANEHHVSHACAAPPTQLAADASGQNGWQARRARGHAHLNQVVIQDAQRTCKPEGGNGSDGARIRLYSTYNLQRHPAASGRSALRHMLRR